jgi:hypothetical protein
MPPLRIADITADIIIFPGIIELYYKPIYIKRE